MESDTLNIKHIVGMKNDELWTRDIVVRHENTNPINAITTKNNPNSIFLNNIPNRKAALQFKTTKLHIDPDSIIQKSSASIRLPENQMETLADAPTIQPNCTKCGETLDNFDEFLERMDGFASNFLIDLVCIRCVQKRRENIPQNNDFFDETIESMDENVNIKSNPFDVIDEDTFNSVGEIEEIKVEPPLSNELNVEPKQNQLILLDAVEVLEEKEDEDEVNYDAVCAATEEYLLTSMSENEGHQEMPLNFYCTACNKKYSSLAKLQAHGFYKHNSDKLMKSKAIKANFNYICDMCNTSYSTLKRLRSHMYYKHTSKQKLPIKQTIEVLENEFKKLYECDICHSDFNHRRVLLNHMHIAHSDNQIDDGKLSKFVCNSCDTVYASYKNLQAHIYYKHSSARTSLNKQSNRKIIRQGKDVLMLIHDKDRQIEAENDSDENEIKRLKLKFKCPLCIRSFATKPLLQTHLKYVQHAKPSMYFCKLCHSNYESSEALRSHNYYKHFKNTTNCTETLNPDDDKFVHSPLVESIEIVNDSIQSDSDASKDNVDDEFNDKQNKFYCSYCYRPYKTKELQLAHEQYHHRADTIDPKKTDFCCTICTKYYNTKKLLQSHMSYKHGKSKYSTFKCRICDEIFDRRSERQKHERCIHWNSSTQKYPCPQCEQEFSAARYLESHIFEHAKYKPFVCHQCGKGYYRKDLLKSHIRSHNTNLYKCDVCAKVFKQAFTLNRHKLMHQGMKMVYTCDQCDMHYADSRDLRRHAFTHGNYKKEFQCTKCGQQFYLQCDLNRHNRLHHSDKKKKVS